MSKKTVEIPIPERPPCAHCGEPAACLVTLVAQDLELTRGEGLHARAYWKPSYDATRVRIETRLCEGCMKAHVAIRLTADATLKASEKT